MALRASIALAVAAAAFSLGATGCTQDPPLATVPSVDLSRFQGQWFEIAHLPRPTQTDCTGTRASYALTSPTTLTLVHQCNEGSLSGPVRQNVANAVVKDSSDAAKLSVDFGGFYGDYWIIDLGQNYEYAVVGHPSRDYLWVLSRTPKLDASTLTDVTKRAQDNGFDVTKLQYTVQPETADPASGPDASTATPPTYGCRSSIGARSTTGASLLAVAAAAGLGALARRRRATGRKPR
jgi:apolipoprotein D and lipocalin family protein